MIKSVSVTNYLGEKMTMELRRPVGSGFVVSNITGIGPGKADINMTELAITDGEIYNSARLPGRNIVLLLRFLWDPLIEDTRHKSYRYFPIKKPVILDILTDRRTVEINGYVESNEPVIFDRQEYAQVSILCPNPYFYSKAGDGKTVTVFYGTDPLFEFPFSNESLTSPLIEFGDLKNRYEANVIYNGDAEIGATIFIDAIGPATNLTIYNVTRGQSMHIDTDKLATITGSGIVAGDTIIINTVSGEKSIQLLRNGVYTNILNTLDRGTDWFTLEKGDNVFTYTADTGLSNLLFRVENQTIYEGV